jgi:hypothetical protein
MLFIICKLLAVRLLAVLKLDITPRTVAVFGISNEVAYRLKSVPLHSV